MRKPIIIVVAMAFLASCTTTKIVTQYEYVVITPPVALYSCPQLKNLPNPETLTNKQVADTIKALYVNLRTCDINMKKIQEFVEKAKAVQTKK